MELLVSSFRFDLGISIFRDEQLETRNVKLETSVENAGYTGNYAANTPLDSIHAPMGW
jgi:hypothetical protein